MNIGIFIDIHDTMKCKKIKNKKWQRNPAHSTAHSLALTSRKTDATVVYSPF